MIEACFGVPGGGKTYYAVHRALQYIASGGAVFTNIRFHGVEPVEDAANGYDKYALSGESNVLGVLKKHYGWTYQVGQYHYIDLESMDTDLLPCIPHGSKSKPILLVLDEVNEWFDSLDGGKLKKDEKYRELFKFLRLSRHYHIDVLFLLQDFATLNARLRGLCQNIYKSTDMQKLRVPGIPFKFPFPWFLWQQFDKAGRVCVKSQTWPKETHIFECYDSYCEFGAVSLSNAQFSSDFGRSGKPQKKVGDMSKYDRVIIYGVLAFLAFGVFGGRRVVPDVSGQLPQVVTVTNLIERVSVPAASGAVAAASVSPFVTVVYEPYIYGCDGVSGGMSRDWVLANGRRYVKGQKQADGLVVDVCREFVRIVGDNGRERFIYPLSIEHHFENASGVGYRKASLSAK